MPTPFKRDVKTRAIYQEPAPHLDKDNPFQSMMERFDVAAELLELDTGLYDVLRSPSRIHITSVPVVMDDGRLRVFEGYRVIHLRGARAVEGRDPVRPGRPRRRGQGARGVDDVEVRRRRGPVRGRQGRRDVRPLADVGRRGRAAHAPLHGQPHGRVRARPGHPRAGHEHERAGHGLAPRHLLDARPPDGDGRRDGQAGSSSAAPRAAARRPAAAS